MNIKAYINLIANRKFEEAIEVIREANPFPAVCGRVCTRPCEDSCELAEKGDSISIRSLKRYASDYELSHRSIVSNPCKILYKEKIAIVGAGPAGLTAAVDLIRIGYNITVFEEKDEPGGMLKYAIPPYRLPDRVLKREIDWIKSLGINIKTSVKIKDPSLLLKKGFSAILIAGGAPKSFPLGIKGEKANGVIDALKFLKNVNSDNPPRLKGKVVVIGGGSTAFDAARSSIRLGAKSVALAYRREKEDMPADKEEKGIAPLEGVEIITLAIPKKIIVKNDVVKGIEFIKSKLGEIDDSGRRKPVPIKNSEFFVEADTIIPAVGAMPDVGLVGGVKVTTPKGVIDVAEDGKTIVDGVFAAGDVEMGSSSVVDAIGRGHIAAKGIHSYIKGINLVSFEEIPKNIQITLGSSKCSNINFKKREEVSKSKLSTFEEVEKSLNDYEAIEEASRCLTCGSCFVCPVCLPNCDNKQLIAEIDNYTFLLKAPSELSKKITDEGSKKYIIKSKEKTVNIKLQSLTADVDNNLCIGCGRCEEVCAYRAIKNIISKYERPVAQVGHKTCRSCSACVSECPTGAISQGYMSDNKLLDRIQSKKTSYEGVKALMSYWSTPSPLFNTYDGVVELMSCRKPSPSFLIRALARSGRGLLVIKPDEITGSHYLPWEESPDEVIEKTKDLLKLVGISPDRIKYENLPKGENPSVLLKTFSEHLDKKHLKMLNVPIPKTIKNPIGEAITILRILGAYPDIKAFEEIDSPSSKQSGKKLFFEACIPLLQHIGDAHKLYDLKTSRNATKRLIDKTNICDGFISELSCPSKGLLNIKADRIENIVSHISEKNKQIIKKIKPSKIVLGTPESYLTFSDDNIFESILSFPEELYKKLVNSKDLYPVNKTIAIHRACTLEKDLFYEFTKKLLKLIPGLKLVELKGECGQSGFNNLDGNSKESAIKLMKEAVDKNADTIVCTSPYCQTHLMLCNREGSWRTADIEISDICQILISSLEGGIV